MYNGIGLLTPRGSGTSGYVQTNKFNLRGRPQGTFKEEATVATANLKPDRGILEHNKKRQLELDLLKLADELEAQGHSTVEIEERLQAERRLALSRPIEDLNAAEDRKKPDTHRLAERKQQQMVQLQNALGLSNVVEGEAFNRELQEERKQKEMQERERKQEQKLRREAELVELREAARQLQEKEHREQGKAAKTVPRAAEHEQERSRGRGVDSRYVRPDSGPYHVRKPQLADMIKIQVERASQPSIGKAGPIDAEDRYQPDAAYEDLDSRHQKSMGQAAGASPTPPPSRRRSGGPSPSPAKVQSTLLPAPPPAKPVSPPRPVSRSDPSPPPRRRHRYSTSASRSPAVHQRREEDKDGRGWEPSEEYSFHRQAERRGERDHTNFGDAIALPRRESSRARLAQTQSRQSDRDEKYNHRRERRRTHSPPSRVADQQSRKRQAVEGKRQGSSHHYINRPAGQDLQAVQSSRRRRSPSSPSSRSSTSSSGSDNRSTSGGSSSSSSSESSRSTSSSESADSKGR